MFYCPHWDSWLILFGLDHVLSFKGAERHLQTTLVVHQTYQKPF